MGAIFWRKLSSHVRGNVLLYALSFFSFLLGVTAGAFGISALSYHQEGDLVNYLNVFLAGIGRWEIDNMAVAQQAIVNNLKFIFVIWFLGLTVVGAPLVLALVTVRGFVLGFTVGFLIQEKASQGILLAIFAVLPQNLFNIPALLISAVAAVSFSLWLIRGRLAGNSLGLPRILISYTSLIGTMAVLTAAGSMVEAYVSPFFVKLIASFFGA